uniref:hypothetical protein n=1 Tax=Allorhizocola rhizosphaerae TaxID=1872709 RepID=UPI0013C3509E
MSTDAELRELMRAVSHAWRAAAAAQQALTAWLAYTIHIESDGGATNAAASAQLCLAEAERLTARLSSAVERAGDGVAAPQAGRA